MKKIVIAFLIIAATVIYNAKTGKYVWFPVEFNTDGTFSLRWEDQWDLSVFRK